MNQVRLLVEWDEASTIRLAEEVWNAGGSVRLLGWGTDEEEPPQPMVALEEGHKAAVA